MNKNELMMYAVNKLQGDIGNVIAYFDNFVSIIECIIDSDSFKCGEFHSYNSNDTNLNAKTFRFICSVDEFNEFINELKDWQRTITATPEHDNINKPAHYDFFPGIEAADIILETLNSKLTDNMTPWQIHCFACKLKYHLRAGKKDNVMQELGKGEKYREMAEVDND